MDDFKFIDQIGKAGQETTILQDKISSLKRILEHEKVSALGRKALKNTLDEVDFILSKYDNFFNSYTQTIASIASADFVYKFPEIPHADDFLYTLTSSLNMMLDELKKRAVKKELIHQMHKLMGLENIALIATDVEGKIKYIKGSFDLYPNFNEQVYSGGSIQGIFKDYSNIGLFFEKGIMPTDVEMLINWKGNFHPCWVSANVCNQMGKIEGMVYVIRFIQSHLN